MESAGLSGRRERDLRIDKSAQSSLAKSWSRPVVRKRIVLNASFTALFLAGMLLVAYPPASQLLSQMGHEDRIAEYVSSIDRQTATEQSSRAYEYNRAIAMHGVHVPDDAFARKEPGEDMGYTGLLDPAGTGMMCSIQIPVIGVRLPVFHGTSEAVLQKGAGHLQGTSLPIGSDGSFPSHTVIAAHSGLTGAAMFDRLDAIDLGEWFCLEVLGEAHWYEVRSKKVVEPDDTGDLVLVETGDFATLVTCTPYGINSHRLLVRGVRGDGPAVGEMPLAFDFIPLLSAIGIFSGGILVVRSTSRKGTHISGAIRRREARTKAVCGKHVEAC